MQLYLFLLLCSQWLDPSSETEKGNLPVAYYSPPESAASNAARLLGVDMKAMEKAMCTHTTLTHGEVIVSPVGAQQAKDVRDAFVKG